MDRIEVDCTTGETTVIPLTPDEIAEHEARIIAAQEAEAAAEAAEAARLSALTKMAQASGLTPDELAALGL